MIRPHRWQGDPPRGARSGQSVKSRFNSPKQKRVLAAIAAFQVSMFCGCVSEPTGRPHQNSTQTSLGASAPDAQAHTAHQAQSNAPLRPIPLLPLIVSSDPTTLVPSSAAPAIVNPPALPKGCIAVDRFHSPQSGITEGQWRFRNNCRAGISIIILTPPDPRGTKNVPINLTPGQAFIEPSFTIERYKYFACPRPWVPFDSSSSPAHLVSPSYETTQIVCLIVDASGAFP